MIQKNFCNIIEWDPLGRWGRIGKSEDYLRKKDILPWAFSFGLQSWSISASYSKSINPSINRSSNVRACCGQRSLWTIKTSDEALNLLTFPPWGLSWLYPARSIWCVTPGKEERVVVLRVSSFHAGAVTEAKGKFAEVMFTKPTGHPHQTDKEGLVTGTS